VLFRSGPEGVAEIRRRTALPLVAIGGITFDRALTVIEAGADSLALIADLYRAGEIEGRVRAYLQVLGRHPMP
jgi:thiamine-phosphate pyrophosphorylase